MLVTAEFVRHMARYNHWQNEGLRRIVAQMDDAALREDRGAFWGSILGTLNHVLWADRVWLSRFTEAPGPGVGMAESPHLTPTPAEWAAERVRTDNATSLWAHGLRNLDLAREIGWHSGVMKADVRRPIDGLIVHFFNHQTHHRGQVHAMLTAAGQTPDDTDLFLMPTA